MRKHFEQTDGNYKATTAYWFKVTAFFVSWLALISYAYSTGSLYAGLLAGFVMNMIGFTVMHDGSHYGTHPPPLPTPGAIFIYF